MIMLRAQIHFKMTIQSRCAHIEWYDRQVSLAEIFTEGDVFVTLRSQDEWEFSHVSLSQRMTF